MQKGNMNWFKKRKYKDNIFASTMSRFSRFGGESFSSFFSNEGASQSEKMDKVVRLVHRTVNAVSNSRGFEKDLKVGFAKGKTMFHPSNSMIPLPQEVAKGDITKGMDSVIGRVLVQATMHRTMAAFDADRAAERARVGTASDNKVGALWAGMEHAIGKKALMSDWQGFRGYVDAFEAEQSIGAEQLQKLVNSFEMIPPPLRMDVAVAALNWNMANPDAPIKTLGTRFDKAIKTGSIILEKGEGVFSGRYGIAEEAYTEVARILKEEAEQQPEPQQGEGEPDKNEKQEGKPQKSKGGQGKGKPQKGQSEPQEQAPDADGGENEDEEAEGEEDGDQQDGDGENEEAGEGDDGQEDGGGEEPDEQEDGKSEGESEEEDGGAGGEEGEANQPPPEPQTMDAEEAKAAAAEALSKLDKSAYGMEATTANGNNSVEIGDTPDMRPIVPNGSSDRPITMVVRLKREPADVKKYQLAAQGLLRSSRQIAQALMFRATEKSEMNRGLTSGDLDDGALHNMSIKQDFPPIWEQRNVTKVPDIAVGLLIDMSGSMGAQMFKDGTADSEFLGIGHPKHAGAGGLATDWDGEQKQLAHAARDVAVSMVEATKLVKGVKTSVFGFESDAYSAAHFGGTNNKLMVAKTGRPEKLDKLDPATFHKNYPTTLVEFYTPAHPYWETVMRARPGHNNGDGFAIMHAAASVAMYHPECKRKFLFVMSDGQPHAEGYGAEGAKSHMTDVCKWAKTQGVEVYGIGMANAYSLATGEEMYGKGKCVVIKDVMSSVGIITQFLRQVIEKEQLTK